MDPFPTGRPPRPDSLKGGLGGATSSLRLVIPELVKYEDKKPGFHNEGRDEPEKTPYANIGQHDAPCGEMCSS